MKQYLGLLQAILDNGVQTGDRTGTGTLTLPGYHYSCRMEQDNDGVIHNFPLLTTKKMSFKSIFEELIWKLRGDTNIRYLVENNNHIWTEWPFKKWLQETGQKNVLENMWKDYQKSDYTDLWKQKKTEFEQRILSDDVFCKQWGELGRTYGFQLRRFGEENMLDYLPEHVAEKLSIDDLRYLKIPGKDQLMDAIALIKKGLPKEIAFKS